MKATRTQHLTLVSLFLQNVSSEYSFWLCSSQNFDNTEILSGKVLALYFYKTCLSFTSAFCQGLGTDIAAVELMCDLLEILPVNLY